MPKGTPETMPTRVYIFQRIICGIAVAVVRLQILGRWDNGVGLDEAAAPTPSPIHQGLWQMGKEGE